MKQLFYLSIFLLFISCNGSTNTQPKNDNSNSDNLDYLKELNGSYTGSLWNLDNPTFLQRLKKLLGGNYSTLEEIQAVETPIKITNNKLVAKRCESHNCSATNFIIIVDFTKNEIYVGIRKDNYVKTYSENENSCQELNNWANGN
jgi:hypothetical protein